jgi:hypothetical protein
VPFAYEAADPGFDAGVTVPTVVEIASGKAVTNRPPEGERVPSIG